MNVRELPRITTFGVPPSGFDPAAASDQELMRYGFPRRPAQPQQRERYEQLLAGLGRDLTVVTARVACHAEGFAGRDSTLRFTDNAAWCGAIVEPPRGDSFDWVFGEWVVPHVGVPTDDQTYHCASWVGIGGFHPNSDLCQSGIASTSWTGSVDSGDGSPIELFAWVEWIPAQPVTISNLTINEGDAITVIVNPGGAASTSASVLFVNRTSSTATSLTIGKPGGARWLADSAEWIVERPLSGPVVNPSLTQLADFGTLVFDMADSGTHAGQSIGAGAGKTTNMFDDNHRIIAKASLPGPTSARCDFVNPWAGWARIRSGVFAPQTPVGVAVDDSDLDLYAVGLDGGVYTSWWRGGPAWGNWANTGSGAFAQLTPISAVARGSDRDLYAVAPDGRVHSAWWRGGPDWGGWAPIGHRHFPPAAPVSAVARDDDLDLFAVATDSHVQSAWWRGGPNWGGWAPIGSGTFPAGTPITAVVREAELHLYAVGMDGGVYSAWWNGNWHDWGQIGSGVFAQLTPVAAAVRGAAVDLFAVGMDSADSAVYSAGWRTGSGWQDWQPVGSGLFAQLTPIAAVARGTNLDLFGVGTDGGLYSAWWRNGAAGWEGWNEIGGVHFPDRAPVSAVTHDDTDIDLFAVDPGGHALTAWLNVP
ncbi:MAG: G1 family glutamic endopeptidase [Segniliparus sp.]|uniref:G1 family glutamic endopeptidase n=1 Tax=Segniliparus sp. TaxID=2804064 RepID=UPI003F34F5B6